ncbi:SDR family oxidoreductase [Actinomycetospora straminea]|uniref:SDR family oxidoreductase n=1 Tax=Actinomycetospora straminea TaxID=663607 RepID=A0ABP9E218_9PSEU|nr:SDR family oxidoreductase [Actinomycetospora straminea]MDD7930875.1 SDR family oxidoreductase [Actinomycetospora straminea]
MKVFVTGATGFVGSAVVDELVAAGHEVVGLARSDAGAAAVTAAGAQVRRGDLADLDGLREAAAAADAVVHTAFVHDFAAFAASAETDRRAIEALGGALVGSDRPLVVSAGTAGLAVGRLATEDDVPGEGSPRVSEQTALAFADRGVRAIALRLPPSVHGEGDHGFVPHTIDIARAAGVSGHPGDGSQRWPSVHRRDAARAYRLAIESAPAGTRLHAVHDEGVPVRAIAEVIGRHLDVPVAAIPAERVEEHFGWIGMFLGLDMAATGARTRELLGWTPTEVGLLADLEAGHYFRETATSAMRG